ncbi:MAG: copper chaperone PCu(A)C [Gammaproteobacteria bacterium]|nr:copper chaperone PCu(A)C [Gammaproteobacteria bacterium]
MKTFRISAVLAATLAFGSAFADGITTDDFWLRASAPGAKMGAGFGVLNNASDQTVHLTAVESQVSPVELHTVTKVDGVMRMRPLENGIEIPANGSVTLKPGSYHLMFVGLREQLVKDESHTLVFSFDNGERLSIDVPVRDASAMNSGAMTHGDSQHDSMDKH